MTAPIQHKATQCFNITPKLVEKLSYFSKSALAEYLQITDPTKVTIVGSVVLTELGEFISADAYVEIDRV